MRHWLIILGILLLGGIIIALFIPAVSTGIGRSDASIAINNCRQLQMAVYEYTLRHDSRLPATFSDLLESGLINQSLFDELTGGRGMYFLCLFPNMKSNDVFIEAYLPKVKVTMTFGGDGTIISRTKHAEIKK